MGNRVRPMDRMRDSSLLNPECPAVAPQQRRRRIRAHAEKETDHPPRVERTAVHELLHLIEPRHNDRFVALLGQHLPSWRQRRSMLNATPLGCKEWDH